MNQKVSVLFAVVVSVGTHPTHVIPENQVTVREPVQSCFNKITNEGIFVVFERASVRFPPRVT